MTSPTQVFEVPPGPVMAVRFSLDGRILAVQRSLTRIDMLLRSSAAASASAASHRDGAAASASSTAGGHAAAARVSGSSGAAAAAAAAVAASGVPRQSGNQSLIAEGRAGTAVRSSGGTNGDGASADAPAVEVPATAAVPVHEYRCKAGERVLGFFWTDCPSCDLVVVTSK